MKKSYKRLVIDTATKYIYLALVIDDQEVESVYEQGDNDHSVTIMPYLENILNKHHVELKSLDEVIVGIGPGSYTGVRIGVTVAKMIGYLNDIPVKQISSLAILASHGSENYILPLIDARRGNAFMALFKNNHSLTYVKKDILQNIERFKQSVDVPYEVIESGKPDISKLLKGDLFETVSDIHGLVPNYLQITEAERNLNHD